jgi:hypothetical protein
MSSGAGFDLWYYQADGETLGPVSSPELRKLLALGRLQPRQAVWRRQAQDSLHVPVEAAALMEREATHPSMHDRG